MAGVATAIGVLAVTATVAAGCALAGVAAIQSARVSAVADTAALAAADAALGFVGGVPCERAGHVVARSGLALTACEVDGVVATVAVGSSAGVFAVQARARAGPPE
ncbi:helicase [Microbacterium sp. NE2HP2]|uniref:helicase n=1 Tax=Microbacterium TaxID=33882 RepID=UPI0023669C58|nr:MULTISPECIES: helicase [Microbacterium]MDD7944877.1 helicase [Microbacterium plantarum]WHE35279.1 helicase [Microbacterium sp. BDGP8]WRK16377.1 helicase [Microbacterium plantarum]